MTGTPSSATASTPAPPGPPVRRIGLAAFSALRYPDYRQYWTGLLVAIIGWQVQLIAQGWLVYQLTDSPAALGFTGLLQALPNILLGLFGGVFADRFDRRRLLMVTQGTVGMLVLIQGILVLTGLVHLWHIYVLAALLGAVWAFDGPARMALIPHLVPREALMNAVATGSMVWQASSIIGPSLAGALIARFDVAPCFFLTTLGMCAMVVNLARLKTPPVIVPNDGQNLAQNLVEGLHFIGGNPVFRTLIGMTFLNAILGMSYMTMMPVFARDILDVGSAGYGYLMGIGGVGAFIGTLIVAGLGGVKQRGRLLLGIGTAFGMVLTVFAASRWVPLSGAALFVLGGLSSIYMTTVNTTLQALVPDHLRGRVMGIYGLTWSLVPFGGMLQGIVSSAAGAPLSVGMGGLLVLALFATVTALSPHVRELRSEAGDSPSPAPVPSSPDTRGR